MAWYHLFMTQGLEHKIAACLSQAAVAETVYWPQLDDDVVQKAQQLSKRWSDGRTRGQIVERARSHAQSIVEKSIRPVIHHSPIGVSGPFRSYAVLDALAMDQVGKKTRVMHLDQDGNTVTLDHERSTK